MDGLAALSVWEPTGVTLSIHELLTQNRWALSHLLMAPGE